MVDSGLLLGHVVEDSGQGATSLFLVQVVVDSNLLLGQVVEDSGLLLVQVVVSSGLLEVHLEGYFVVQVHDGAEIGRNLLLFLVELDWIP